MRKQPSLFASVGARNSVAIRLPAADQRIKRAAEDRLDLPVVLWLRAFSQPFIGDCFVGSEPIDLPGAGRIIERAGSDVPIPDPDVSRFGCQRQSAFGLDVIEFGELLFCDIPI